MKVYFPRELENPLRLELERLLDEEREKKPELLDDEGLELEDRELENDFDVDDGREELELLEALEPDREYEDPVFDLYRFTKLGLALAVTLPREPYMGRPPVVRP